MKDEYKNSKLSLNEILNSPFKNTIGNYVFKLAEVSQELKSE